jgi:hypothetical protein
MSTSLRPLQSSVSKRDVPAADRARYLVLGRQSEMAAVNATCTVASKHALALSRVLAGRQHRSSETPGNQAQCELGVLRREPASILAAQRVP